MAEMGVESTRPRKLPHAGLIFLRTKFWQNYFLGKEFAKTSTDLFLNSNVANGKGEVWGGTKS